MSRNLPPDTEWISPGYQGSEDYDPDASLIAPGQAKQPPPSDEALLAAAEPDAEITGAMIALVPSAADLKRLAIEGQEPADILHLTLLFLGEAADYTPAQQAAVTAGIEDMFAGFGPVDGVAFGCDYWNPGGDQPAWVLQVGDAPDSQGALHDARETAEHALANAGIHMLPAQHTPWVPHVCLAYDTDPALLQQMIARVGPITFDTARVAFAGKVTDVTMKGGAA